jgi:hypothetical protein
LDSILDRWIDRLDQETPENIVREYPQFAENLGPMLHIADSLRALEDVRMSSTAKQAGRMRLRQAVLTRQHSRKRRFGPIGNLRLATWAGLLLICIASVSGVTLASAHALPDEPLYGWKRASERLWLSVQPTPEREVAVSLTLADRRVDETKLLYQRSKQVDGKVIGELKRDYTRTLALIATLPQEQALPLLKQTETLGAQHEQELTALAEQSTGAQQDLLLSAVRISQWLRLSSSTRLVLPVPSLGTLPLPDRFNIPGGAAQWPTLGPYPGSQPDSSDQPTSEPQLSPTGAPPEQSAAPDPNQMLTPSVQPTPSAVVQPTSPPAPTAPPEAVWPTAHPVQPTAGRPAVAPKPTAKPVPPKAKPTAPPKKAKPTAPPKKPPAKGKPQQPPGPPNPPPGKSQPPGTPGDPPGKGKK